MRSVMLPRLPLECTAQVPDRRGVAAGSERHVHDVEAAARLAETTPLEVVAREQGQAPALGGGDGRAGRISPARAARLHLDEHPHVAVAADEIELAESRADVPFQDVETGGGEVCRRRILAGVTALASPVLHGTGIRQASPPWRCPGIHTPGHESCLCSRVSPPLPARTARPAATPRRRSAGGSDTARGDPARRGAPGSRSPCGARSHTPDTSSPTRA